MINAESRPHVFIVIATFNPNLDFLAKQVESIVSQTYQDLDVILVDDASQDGFHALLKNICELHQWYFFPQDVNRGAVATFEIGIEKAIQLGAEYIALCDQDDIWDSDKIEVSIKEIRSRNCDLVHSDLRLIDSNDNLLASSVFEIESRRKKLDIIEQVFLRNNVTGCSSLFSRSLAIKALPFPQVQKRDPEFYHDHWLAVIAQAKGGIYYINRPLLSYRQHGHNLVGVGKAVGILKRLKTAKAKTDKLAASRSLLAKSVQDRTGESLQFFKKLSQCNLREIKVFLQWQVGKWVSGKGSMKRRGFN